MTSFVINLFQKLFGTKKPESAPEAPYKIETPAEPAPGGPENRVEAPAPEVKPVTNEEPTKKPTRAKSAKPKAAPVPAMTAKKSTPAKKPAAAPKKKPAAN